MQRREFLKIVSGAIAATLAPDFTFAEDKSVSKKPNFVFVLIDDLGWTDAGCFNSTFYETPNTDKLAKQGMRFTNAYAAAPVCSPTRVSIMTGKYPARLNLTDWLGPDKFRAKGKLEHAEFIRYMSLEEITIAEALKKAGYSTAFIGKWHLGDQPYYPQHQGFDVNVAGSNQGFPPDYFHPYKWKHYYLDLPNSRPGDYLTDHLTDEAIKFLEKNKDNPFFLLLSHYAVHTPLKAKKDLEEKYKAKAADLPPEDKPRYLPEGPRQARQVQDHAVYAAMIQSVDESLGAVMQKLEQLGIADNTIIIFTSDNGGLSTMTKEDGPTSNVPLRAGKGWLYEGGIRVPLIIKWPGTTKPATKCDELVTSTDFYPTMLEMADLPLKSDRHIDGISLLPLLRQTGNLNRDAIYFHYPHYSNQGFTPASAVRAGDYKLIEFYEDDHIELYNLKDDLSEKNNLVNSMPEKAAEMKAMLRVWKKQVDAKLPTKKTAAEEN